jgi:hypothetical protein
LQNDGRHYARVLVLLDALFSDAAPGAGLAELEFAFSRTPRPFEMLAAPSSIISIPAASIAVINFTSESTLPRTIDSEASIR